jgi:hypothetical protein
VLNFTDEGLRRALREIDQGLQLAGEAATGRVAESLAASTTAERKAWASADPQYCLMLAECYALADRPDDAFEWLESLVRTSALPYPFLSMIDPFLTKLRTTRGGIRSSRACASSGNGAGSLISMQ